MLPQRLLAAILGLFLLLGIGVSGCGHYEPMHAQRQGAHLYQKMCAVCHGTTGAGYKADQAPALTHLDFLTSASDEFLRSAITDGRKDTTMSAWSTVQGGPLARADVDAIIKFIRTWQRQPRAALDERPLAGNGVSGAPVYDRECARCHGARGTGGPFVHIGNPQLLSTATNGFLRQAIRHGRAGTAMPGFSSSLGDPAIEDVIALLRNWQREASLAARSTPPQATPIPLGPVPLNPSGPEPSGFKTYPAATPADLIKGQLDRHARMALLDARAPADYRNEHIAGAVSVPFYDPDPYMPALPKDTWLVCYCSCPHAESGRLAQSLVAKGFSKVTVLDEGLGHWKMKKYGTHTGDEP
jgi:cytochrome c oxidase cbb3-type subunit 3